MDCRAIDKGKFQVRTQVSTWRRSHPIGVARGAMAQGAATAYWYTRTGRGYLSTTHLHPLSNLIVCSVANKLPKQGKVFQVVSSKLFRHIHLECPWALQVVH